MSELKPCPFCGGEAEMSIKPRIPRGFDYTPRCKNPSCAGRLTKIFAHDEAKAVSAWNRRADNE